MKKVVFGLVVGLIIGIGVSTFGAVVIKWTAELCPHRIVVDGAQFISSEAPAVVISGRTYLPVKAIGDALKVSVKWNGDKKQVEIGQMPITYKCGEMEVTIYNHGSFINTNIVSGIAVDIQYKNIGQRDLQYSTNNLKLGDFLPFNIGKQYDDFISMGTLKPGDSVKGKLVYPLDNYIMKMKAPYEFRFHHTNEVAEFILKYEY